MRPLKGVVVGGGRMLEVRLASGRIVSVPHTKGVRRWDVVDVYWDFLKGVPVRVERRNLITEEAEIPEPTPVGEEGESPPEEDEESEASDSDSESGALCQEVGCVGSAESDFWSLVLSDGVLASGGCV